MIFSVSTTRKTRRWQFPSSRFVTYEPQDEQWCRFFGIGEEVEITETLTIPQAYLESFQDGVATFRAIPTPGVDLCVTR